ncbi:hypothetical protein AS594_38820 [Streptomyces agglomeratus]|uniref:Uncharacterized protein n=1 Tax=Streptomyces agglomeratus TaxID=285458 RepID=A0A1E5NYZ9_9ACTN|nr:hypothetical protein [Streptomyces agglomeratus]OEJ21504.1 hypothetical protein AS594_38820 [Streptomyces agglomeratus]
MFTPIRSAAAYAAIVTLGAWLTGLVVNVAYHLTTAFGEDFQAARLITWDDAGLIAAELAALTTARKLLPAMPRWKITVFDAPLYTAVMLVVAVAASASEGLAYAVDGGFVYLIFAMLTLHLPAAYLLSWWASGHLTLAMKSPGDRSILD